ncbi:MAG: ORF6N domain-containing protein [Nitrospirae bacterium]|nr:ORF6N domain-containing protein [Nitrospirota bacterium]
MGEVQRYEGGTPNRANRADYSFDSWSSRHAGYGSGEAEWLTTFNLNKAVKRNGDRFPEDFMFRLSAQETAALTFQSGISKSRGSVGRRSAPYS